MHFLHDVNMEFAKDFLSHDAMRSHQKSRIKKSDTVKS